MMVRFISGGKVIRDSLESWCGADILARLVRYHGDLDGGY